MKNLTIIRFVLGVVLLTLGCLGLFMDIRGVGTLGSLAWLFIAGTSDLTKPVPQNERWLTIIVVSVILSIILGLPLLHAAYPNARFWNFSPNPTTRHLLAVLLWFFSLWATHRRWQSEKGKALLAVGQQGNLIP